MSKSKVTRTNLKKAVTLKLEINSKYNRCFSPDFKREKVSDIVSKKISIKQFCELYKVSRTTVYKWIYKFSNLEKGTKQVIQMDSEVLKTKQLHEKVAELERIIGQKQLEIDFLNKSFELASTELGYDIKKKFATLQSKVLESKKTNSVTK